MWGLYNRKRRQGLEPVPPKSLERDEMIVSDENPQCEHDDPQSFVSRLGRLAKAWRRKHEITLIPADVWEAMKTDAANPKPTIA